jgi:putative addiction module killer protein
VLVRPREIDVYALPDGKTLPFNVWMANLNDIIGKAAIDSRVGLLRRGSLGKKYEDIGDGLIELKVDSGPGYRIYIADDGKNSLILCAGPKKTQQRDIKSAKDYWKDYKARG